jgi:phosphatidylserine/phosphatidylglycerophosphate/cardiolipin synthase-like enzyme
LTMLEYDQIEIVRLNRVWLETRRSLPKSDQSKELLDVLEIENWFLGYRTMRVLQYINRNNGNLIVHVYDGVERSSRHEIALLKMEEEGLHSLRAEVKRGPEEIPDPIIEVIDEELFQAAKRKALEIPKLEQNISKKEQQIEETEDIKRTSPKNEDSLQSDQQERELREEINRLKQQINQLEEAAPTIRILSMTEHRPMLLEALRDAKRRVVIVSPWLSPTAVDQELRTLIEQTIARGVEVWMGYGFGDPDHREEHTLKLLHRIQKGRGGKNLRLRRLAESHAKVVICDEAYMITTSFNWLSFAGDPNRGNRVEFGTLTRDPKAVRAMLDRILPMFEESQKNIVL